MKMFGQRERFGSHLGLERIQLVCAALGDPQKQLKFIHIAGTNGKGSVSAMLAEVLKRSGFKVGLFTSPHLEHYSERFQVNGVPIDSETLENVVEHAEKASKEVEASYPSLGSVTEFELATAVAFLFFKQAQVDLVVLETGLGGRLDATNVVHPELTVITTIGLDHQDRLGTSLEEIAQEKAGIIKENVPVISGVQSPTAEEVLKRTARQRKAPWRSTKEIAWESQGFNLSGGSLCFPELGLIKIGLLGEHQLENGATALLALQELRNLGWDVSLGAIREGLPGTRWPGRLEVVSQNPFILLDGSHNRDGIAALIRSLEHFRKELGGEKFTFVFGMLHNKELNLLDPLLPLARRFIFTAADSGRLEPMDPEVLANYAREKGVNALSISRVSEALKEAEKTSPICICGSLYLVGTVKRFFPS